MIADDEAAARRRIRRLLLLEPECEFAGECGNGAEAVDLLSRQQTDILFLSAHMPGMNGFEVLRALPRAHSLVIFTAEREDLAARAFDVHAFDYLVKPFERKRFRDAVQRACAHLAKPRPESKAPDRIAVRNNGRILFLRLRDIDWIEASDNYVCLHCGKETHVLRETMTELEKRLDPAQFIRVHRSAIVNMDRIRELQPWFHGDYRILLHDGTELALTKNHRERLESALLLGA